MSKASSFNNNNNKNNNTDDDDDDNDDNNNDNNNNNNKSILSSHCLVIQRRDIQAATPAPQYCRSQYVYPAGVAEKNVL